MPTIRAAHNGTKESAMAEARKRIQRRFDKDCAEFGDSADLFPGVDRKAFDKVGLIALRDAYAECLAGITKRLEERHAVKVGGGKSAA